MDSSIYGQLKTTNVSYTQIQSLNTALDSDLWLRKMFFPVKENLGDQFVNSINLLSNLELLKNNVKVLGKPYPLENTELIIDRKLNSLNPYATAFALFIIDTNTGKIVKSNVNKMKSLIKEKNLKVTPQSVLRYIQLWDKIFN